MLWEKMIFYEGKQTNQKKSQLKPFEALLPSGGNSINLQASNNRPTPPSSSDCLLLFWNLTMVLTLE